MKSRDSKSQSKNDLNQFSGAAALFESEAIDLIERIEAFPKYASRQSIAKFLTKYEIFKKILGVNGSIVECGALHGAGTLTWAKLSAIFEPANHTRKVFSFDTFEGFPSVHENDSAKGTFNQMHVGGLTGSSEESVRRAIEVFDMNRPISHIAKVELVKGDIMQTADAFVEANPHLVVALLYLDFDLYEPTKKALEVFLPKMPKGSIIVFDELNAQIFPGETRAVDEVVGLRNLKIERFPFDSYVSYAQL
ncbi:8-demethyl-8-(2,3-dimethoxy-alpha-L-rhamnosyl)-tetracenomycin-C 4'-O-methyltransferase [Ensifer sp. M14]|uniref:TylF/MycF/NovP-related O-methyltransferase n=1 Tax=Ensifer sp. M14 TaxID=2203782 RepID=UPI000E1E0980|nr:TylF/MycF/NovP-related O-methyltransferase [Ensifer sp. M14]RDL51247.1 8-demethyl-8-(2,3-dimethoxy-alpha-L-rhamnosyl)-tetracenomycin-C 4'-O-methyltransferase [Ensifer sp. M14]